MTQRRTLLRTTSAAVALALSGRGFAQAAAPDPLAPWAMARAADHPDWRLRAAGWAVLAPNPHNRQPWLLDLSHPDQLALRCDLDRRLPVTDPLDRQITIGLGAFAALFRMAAAAEGIAVALTPFPEGAPDGRLDGRPVALLRRVGGPAAPDPLFAHAVARRSAKQPFDMARPPAGEALAALRALAAGTGTVSAAEPLAALRDLIWRAWETEVRTEAAHRESVELMRLGEAEVAAQPDGISIWGAPVAPMIASGALSRATLADPASPAFEFMVGTYRRMLGATPTMLWTASDADTKPAALAAGADWLRLNLAATSLGLALHPVSQALQEYPEMAPHHAQVHRLLGIAAPGRVQMLARIGHLPEGVRLAPTPRWPVHSRIAASAAPSTANPLELRR